MESLSTSSPPVLNLYNGRGSRRLVAIDDLLGMESAENYTWLLWQNGDRLLLPRTLKHVEARLPSGQFIRLNRHCTVNIDCIERIERPAYGCMFVWLRTGECHQVARRRIMPIRQQLQHHPTLARYVV